MSFPSHCQKDHIVYLTRLSRFRPGTLDVYDFHGSSRASTSDALLRHDLVLTTYHTLAADWKSRRILQDIGWFRVVLDEGASTGFTQAFNWKGGANRTQHTGFETNPPSFSRPLLDSRLIGGGA